MKGSQEGIEIQLSRPGWRVTWRKFKRHRIGLLALSFILFLVLICIFAEFISPFSLYEISGRGHHNKYAEIPPMLGKIHFLSKEGFSPRPFIYDVEKIIDPKTFREILVQIENKRYYICFLARGEEYRLWGLFRHNRHLFGACDSSGRSVGPLFLFGTNSHGQDLLSMILYGGRITLSIALGVTLFSFLLLGIPLGSISGYFGGKMDILIQRVIEITLAIPRLALLMALTWVIDYRTKGGAPTAWLIYFSIVGILSLVNWAPLAREIRGQVLALREEEFTLAAVAVGASSRYVIRKHILKNLRSYLVVSATLTFPNVIILESILSFVGHSFQLGIGIKDPLMSWGSLLGDAYSAFPSSLWLFIPALFIFATVLSFNLLGDVLRDALEVRW